MSSFWQDTFEYLFTHEHTTSYSIDTLNDTKIHEITSAISR